MNFIEIKCRLEIFAEEEDIYKKMVAYIHQIYSDGLLKLKNMNWFIVCASIYINFLDEFYLGYIIGSQYMSC